MVLSFIGLILMFAGAIRDDCTPYVDDTGLWVFVGGLFLLLIGLAN